MKIRPIKSMNDATEARDTLERLLLSARTPAVDDEIEVLAVLLEQYERAHITAQMPTPSDAIKFRMAELGITPRQLERFIGSRSRVHEILTGARPLSIDMIRALHDGLGIPYASLIEDRASKPTNKLTVSSATLEGLRTLGFELRAEDLPLFIQSSLPLSASPALHKKTLTERAASKTDHNALTVWQAAVARRALDNLPTKAFARSSLTPNLLRELARMSNSPNGPRKAVGAVHKMGIAVVFLDALPGTYLDGAAMLGRDDVPIIALTLRHNRTDSFWFTFLHELCHLHLHYDQLSKDISAFFDDLDASSQSALEREADELARISLIPDQILSQINWTETATAGDLQAIASRARVHISIVAGRWQRDFKNYRRFSRLIERDTVRQLFGSSSG